MSKNKKEEGVDNLDIYLKNALDTNLYFLKVKVAINILFHALMFFAMSYLIHELLFKFSEINTTTFVKELAFLLVSPIIFKVLTIGGYKKSRHEHYTNIIKNNHEQK